MQLYEHQLKALDKMRNGCVLAGGTGSGKSITAISYFYLQNGGDLTFLLGDEYVPMDDLGIDDLYIITTAQKRDKHEWDGELCPFLMSTNPDASLYKQQKVIVDSWNNISKYVNVTNAFFIFDEQRAIGRGEWAKTFIKIARQNKWIMLSATPGDKWEDYAPLFIANGFYRNFTDFNEKHLVFKRFSSFPQVERYLDTNILERRRNQLLIPMWFERKTEQIHKYVYCDWDIKLFKQVFKDRWNIYKDKPIETAGELCYTLREIVNTDVSRKRVLFDILEDHPKSIIFYNFDYELSWLKEAFIDTDFELSEWNGHIHQPIPSTDKWVYLVQYTAGCEGWNCTTTNTIIFISQNYSYRVLDQAIGRIDRLNTPYSKLYYYHLTSRSGIDLAIKKSLDEKKKFNAKAWVKHLF